ncbi:uncharacterized protein LOC126260696 [Schistocerca nitens]|uniref:uncharacterized protein LOC126260696 n=1 Tax=Schistocerca nitens TaxID=7011 RepID=UPI00211898E8|nr:uncharacterized protein LOC126260696 [Schistocerca nitens]
MLYEFARNAARRGAARQQVVRGLMARQSGPGGGGGQAAEGAVAWHESLLLAGAGLVAAWRQRHQGARLPVLCFTGGGARLRNLLHVHACVADLLVCGVAAPLAAWESRWWLHDPSAAAAADLPPPLVRRAVAFAQPASIFCQLLWMGPPQGVPVAASTLLLAMLAADRLAAVRRPRLYAAWRRLGARVAAAAWLGAALSAAPLLAVGAPPAPAPAWLSLARLLAVHALPCAAVAACHAAVCATLGRASLLAAAARGEVPLPMPLLCRPRHVIIVASVANDAPSKVIPFVRGDTMMRRVAGDDSDSEDDSRIQADLADLRRSSRRRGPQSLRSRRRLARMLAAQLALFAGCWLPHAAAAAVAAAHLGAPGVAAGAARRLLLLGHAHSAAAPLLYWALNRRALACGHWAPRLRAGRTQQPPPPSSTNEAALGPFHPRFITPRPQPRCETSHFLR